MTDKEKENDKYQANERPPLFPSWDYWYLLVLVFLVLLIVLFYLFTKNFA